MLCGSQIPLRAADGQTKRERERERDVRWSGEERKRCERVRRREREVRWSEEGSCDGRLDGSGEGFFWVWCCTMIRRGLRLVVDGGW